MSRARFAFLMSSVSLASLVLLSSTWSPLADYWTALPFALMGWAGFLAAAAGAVGGSGPPRVLAFAFALTWSTLAVLTWHEGANDTLAVVRRSLFAFIAF